MKHTAGGDVFHGSGCIDLPNPEGIAATWHFIKALCGNTHPGTTLPFGKYSVCPYSGGYSAGYGTNKINCGGPVEQLMPELKLKGFSHFQNSGTGAIGVYYNYAVVKPFYGSPAENYGVTGESASPGYYTVTLSESGICCELTVCKYAALHRYSFDREGGAISIDFTNDGLYDQPFLRGKAIDPVIIRVNDRELRASVTLQGVRFHFVARFKGSGALDDDGIYRMKDAGKVELSLTANTTSMNAALAEAEHTLTFDDARKAADEAWEDTLSRIEIDCEDENETKLFYSNLYHSLVKPCDWENGGFLWEGTPFVVDQSLQTDYRRYHASRIQRLHRGRCLPKTTHILDIAEGCAAVAEIADRYVMTEEAVTLRGFAQNWRAAFDPKTGMLYADREYYEGNHHNYSFRPMREMEERIALCGRDCFEAALDCFFGFAKGEDISARFEGFNNETDMESPYAYSYIGRQDKLCEILDNGDRYMFRAASGGTGSGGIPGNNDSGGLSSCWLWNVLGIFPISGQNLMLIAKPKFRRAVMKLATGRTLTILRDGDGAYPKSASFNGNACERLKITSSAMMEGGELVIRT